MQVDYQILAYSDKPLLKVRGRVGLIYCRYISLINVGHISDIFVRKYRIFSIYTIFMEFKKLI